MIVFPAIDIRAGQCVRLVQGDFARETVFDADPAEAAMRWASLGAQWLHVVDLDGARSGTPMNLAALKRIVQSVAIPVQFGGGMRSDADIRAAFAHGAARVVVGTAAVDNPDWVTRAIDRWSDSLAIGLDARDGQLATAGWMSTSAATPLEVARQFQDCGAKVFIYTDIARDGTLAGPNLEGLAAMIAAVGRQVIASGGVGSIADVDRIARTGAGGVIIGRALYDGRLTLEDALAVSQNSAGRSV